MNKLLTIAIYIVFGTLYWYSLTLYFKIKRESVYHPVLCVNMVDKETKPPVSNSAELKPKLQYSNDARGYTDKKKRRNTGFSQIRNEVTTNIRTIQSWFFFTQSLQLK